MYIVKKKQVVCIVLNLTSSAVQRTDNSQPTCDANVSDCPYPKHVQSNPRQESHIDKIIQLTDHKWDYEWMYSIDTGHFLFEFLFDTQD